MTSTPLKLRVFGLDTTVELSESNVESVSQQWAWCLPDSPLQREISYLPAAPDKSTQPATITLHRDDSNDDDGRHLGDYRLTTSLTAGAISRRSQEYLMFHAGGIAEQSTGRVAMLVAASGTGKTTATRFFCTHGYGYVTDETLITNHLHEVLPYPKPLSVVIDPERVTEKEQHNPSDLGLAEPPSTPLTLDAVILLERDRNVDDPAPGPRLEPIGLFEGLTMILPQSSAMPEIPDCLDLLGKLCCEAGGIFELHYREISETLDLIPPAFDQPAIEPFWTHVPGNVAPEQRAAANYRTFEPNSDADEPITLDVVFERGTFLDALAWDEAVEALLLCGPVPIHLKGVGALAWLELDVPRSAGELLEVCREVFGEHPMAESLLIDGLDQLRRNGVISIVTEAATQG